MYFINIHQFQLLTSRILCVPFHELIILCHILYYCPCHFQCLYLVVVQIKCLLKHVICFIRFILLPLIYLHYVHLYISDLKNIKIYLKVHIQGFSNITEQTQTLSNIFILTVGSVLGSVVSSPTSGTSSGKSGISGTSSS